MSWQSNVDVAVQHQLYRRVAVDSLSPAGELPMPPTGTDESVQAALGYANTDDTWLRIGQQLAFLKDSDGYLGSYLGRGSTGALHVITAEAWSGIVTPSFFEERFDWIWSIFRGVARLAPDFSLPMEVEIRDFIQRSAAVAPEPLQPWLGVAGSLANLLLALAESSGAAIGIFLLVDTDGLSPETKAKAGRSDNIKSDRWGLHARTLTAVAVDLVERKAHGHPPPRSLDLGMFNASLRGARW